MKLPLPCVLVSLVHCTCAYRILVVSNMEPSHVHKLNTIGIELVQRGHEVYTTLSSNFHSAKKTKYASAGLKILEFQSNHLEVVEDYIENMTLSIFSSEFTWRKVIEGAFANLYTHRLFYGYCKCQMDDTVFIDKVRKLNFDMAIVDGFPHAPCQYLLPQYLGIPYVTEQIALDPFTQRIPALPSIQPLHYLKMDDNMAFHERFINFVIYLLLNVFGGMATWDPFDLPKTYTPGKSYMDMARESRLFITAIDHVAEFPMAVMPNIIRVPGITFTPAKPLSGQFERIVNQAENGVVVVSFGSLFASLPKHVAKTFMLAFSQVNQTIIWRYSGPNPDGITVPGNVILSKWIPQNDLLGSNKTVLFITHCGNNGRSEALYHSKPMVAFPLFAEQPHNAFMISQKGFGKYLDLTRFTAQELVDAMNEVIYNTKYKQNVELAASMIKSLPEPPIKTICYWIEHVTKFGGEHLRSHALDMPVYSYLMMDVLAVVAIALLLMLLVIVRCIRTLLKMCYREKSKRD